MVKEIPLTQGKVTLVDDEDYEKIMKYKWCAHRDHNTFYVKSNKLIKGSKKFITYSLHRLILNPNENEEVDHINGDGLDNRRCNLRICTHQQNGANRIKNSIKCSSQYKGVIWHKQRAKWQAYINSRTFGWKYLGLYQSEVEAAKAYDEAAKKLFGEYAKLNFRRMDKKEVYEVLLGMASEERREAN